MKGAEEAQMGRGRRETGRAGAIAGASRKYLRHLLQVCKKVWKGLVAIDRGCTLTNAKRGIMGQTRIKECGHIYVDRCRQM